MDCSKLNLNETMQAVMSRQEEIVEENKDRDNTDGVARIIYMFSQMMIKQLESYRAKKPAPSLGIIRLDYDYPTALGDISCPDSFSYNVYYKVVPGLTFEMCQSGKLTGNVHKRFKESIEWLVEEKKVSAITGNCGFMMYFQEIAREIAKVPVFMSSLCQLSSINCAIGPREHIIILTSNGKSLEDMHDLIRKEFNVDPHDERYHIVGCENVEGFEAVALGGKVDTQKVEPGIVKKALETIDMYPKSKAFLLECTELPPYADAIRFETGLPVFDAITMCNFCIDGFRDHVRFGKQEWQRHWDRK